MMGFVEATFLFVMLIILISLPAALIFVFGAQLIPERLRRSWRERLEGTGPLVIVAVMLVAGYALMEGGCEGPTPALHENDLQFFGTPESNENGNLNLLQLDNR